LDIALHPDFSRNGLIYLTYLKDVADGGTTALAQAHFDGTALTGLKDIFVADAASVLDGGESEGKSTGTSLNESPLQ
jgi:aldose sugar dehydrogenase